MKPACWVILWEVCGEGIQPDMWTFLVIVCSVPLMGLLWLAWADWRLRRAKAAGWQRAVLAGMVVLNVVGFAGLLLSRVFRWDFEVPLVLLISTFVWHIVVLPAVLLGTTMFITGSAGLKLARVFTQRGKAFEQLRVSIAESSEGGSVQGDAAAPSRADGADSSSKAITAHALEARGPISRRQFLAAGVVGGPMLMQATAITGGLAQLGAFRLRKLVVTLPQLPIDFDGFTIAHITDTHVGRFTSGRTLDAIASAVNALRADCVVHTGDLINDSLEDMEPACRMLAQLRSTHGTFIVEGNHDLFESRTRFAELLRTRELQDAKLTLLLNEGSTIYRGSGRLQLLGLQWGNTSTQDIRTDRARGPMLEEHCATIDSLRDSRALQVLLAHHPDAFDHALARGIPLTIAGHTHGGQLNIAPGVGPASTKFKYLSGLYERVAATGERAACIVGNGTGNWFPLRINAPAEIIQVVLRKG